MTLAPPSQISLRILELLGLRHLVVLRRFLMRTQCAGSLDYIKFGCIFDLHLSRIDSLVSLEVNNRQLLQLFSVLLSKPVCYNLILYWGGYCFVLIKMIHLESVFFLLPSHQVSYLYVAQPSVEIVVSFGHGSIETRKSIYLFFSQKRHVHN